MKLKFKIFALCFLTTGLILAQTALKKSDKNFNAFNYDDAVKQ